MYEKNRLLTTETNVAALRESGPSEWWLFDANIDWFVNFIFPPNSSSARAVNEKM